MKFHIFPATDSPTPQRAILLFAGWGMDEKPFERIGLNGYRLIAVWDYRDSSFPKELDDILSGCGEIAVIAWSFGVPAATRFILSHPQLPISARIAVNGTTHPVDDNLGIPETIFRGTLEGLTEKSLSKFYLRMAGSGEAFRKFAEQLPLRDIEGLREELSAIEKDDAVDGGRLWDCAIVSRGDRIIPPANQVRAWRQEAFEIIETEGPHLPDFNAILGSMLTEKGLVADKFTRAASTYDANAQVQHGIASKLCAMIPAGIATADVLEIGGGTGHTTRLLAERIGSGRITVWDLHIPSSMPSAIGDVAIVSRECDAETEIRHLPDAGLDLIFSASTVQWFNSLPEFLRQCSRALRKGGAAVISTFGPETMLEIRSRLPHPVHYPSAETIAGMTPEGCTAEIVSEERHSLLFPTPVEALRHAKLTGVNALSSRHSSRTAREVMNSYPLTPTGEAPVTYHPIYIVFRKQ